jgi:hypothetical protein
MLLTAPWLGGCADITKVFPTASAKFAQDRQLERTLTAQLVSELRNEDTTLNFLSASTYSCGDPKNPRLRGALAVSSVKKKVKDDNANLSKRLRNALETLDAYAKALTSIQQQNTDAKAQLKFLVGLIDAGSKIPGAPNYSAIADAALPVGSGLFDLFSLEALRQLAIAMQGPLQNAVTTIKNNLTELTGEELNAFHLWDQCARETLVYLREVPIGLPGFPSFVAQSSGVELQNAYQAYLTKRASFQSPDLVADLQAILEQNKNLATGVYNNPDALIAAITNAGTLASKLQPTTPTKGGASA